MGRFVAVLAVIVAIVAFAWRARPREIEFCASFDAALEKARSERAWVVVHVRREDRPLGEKMDRETLRSREVEALTHSSGRSRAGDASGTGFVHVRVDAAREIELATRLAGPGAALATVVTDARGDVVALLAGFVEAGSFVAFLESVRARRPAIEAATARLESEPADVAARLDLATALRELGAAARAEAEVERARRELDGPRALALHAELLAARGQIAAAEELRRELRERYPSAPFAAPSAAPSAKE